MLEYSTYSVISPEGCASILWKSADKAEKAAEVMGITSKRLSELELIDEIIAEPLGAAHRDYAAAAKFISDSLEKSLSELLNNDIETLLSERQMRIRQYGHFNS
jgi:acetyl-CoA carboxylase carboxyl transferase subunit alpha